MFQEVFAEEAGGDSLKLNFIWTVEDRVEFAAKLFSREIGRVKAEVFASGHPVNTQVHAIV